MENLAGLREIRLAALADHLHLASSPQLNGSWYSLGGGYDSQLHPASNPLSQHLEFWRTEIYQVSQQFQWPLTACGAMN